MKIGFGVGEIAGLTAFDEQPLFACSTDSGTVSLVT